MKKGGGGEPTGALSESVKVRIRGSICRLQDEFAAVCVADSARAGPGPWSRTAKSLAHESTPNQDNPLMAGVRPVMGLDVWEHAYI